MTANAAQARTNVTVKGEGGPTINYDDLFTNLKKNFAAHEAGCLEPEGPTGLYQWTVAGYGSNINRETFQFAPGSYGLSSGIAWNRDWSSRLYGCLYLTVLRDLRTTLGYKSELERAVLNWTSTPQLLGLKTL